MLRFLTAIGLAAAAVLIVASATMNYMFASSLGKTPVEGYIPKPGNAAAPADGSVSETAEPAAPGG